jgi:hypothetical protein
MKQHITVNQLYKVSEKGKELLRAWCKPKIGELWTDFETVNIVDPYGKGVFDGDRLVVFKPDGYPLLSIGQMIEFLEEAEGVDIIEIRKIDPGMTIQWCVCLRASEKLYNNKFIATKLCDAL